MLSLALTTTAIVYAAITLLLFTGFTIFLYFQKHHTREHILSTILTSYSVLFWAVSFGIACPSFHFPEITSSQTVISNEQWIGEYSNISSSQIVIVVNSPWPGLTGYEDTIENGFLAYIVSNSVAHFIRVLDHLLILKNHKLSKYLGVKIAMGAGPFLGFLTFYSFLNDFIFYCGMVSNVTYVIFVGSLWVLVVYASAHYQYFMNEPLSQYQKRELRKKMLKYTVIEAAIYVFLFLSPLAMGKAYQWQTFGAYLTIFYAGIPVIIYLPSWLSLWKMTKKLSKIVPAETVTSSQNTQVEEYNF